MSAALETGQTTVTPRVLVIARSYPNAVFPTLGLWTEQPTRMLAERCDVRVLSPVPYCPPLPERGPFRQYARFRRIAARDRVNGVEVHRPRYPAGPGTSLYALEPTAWWRSVGPAVEKLRHSFPFDLVHAHFVYPEGVVGARIAARYDVPLAITEHAPWEPWLRRPGVARQALPAARQAAALLPVSSAVRDSIHAYLSNPPGVVDVIPPGVDGDAFPLGEGPRKRRVLFVGFLNDNKGLDILFEAIALLGQAGEAATLLAVGGSHYRNTRLQEERIRRLPAQLGIADRVEFAGVLPQHAVAALMRESAVVVLPSRAESFGAVLVEALASGTPVVATRCGGPEDIVDDGLGFLVPRDDTPALAEAIARILARPEDYPPARLRAITLARFGLASVVDRIHGQYLAVTGARAAA